METAFPTLEHNRGRVLRERLLSDLGAVARDAGALMRLKAGDAGETVRAVHAHLAATIAQARASCAALQVHSILIAAATGKRIDRSIRAHPYRSAAIALGIGFYLGARLARKRDSARVLEEATEETEN
ncbi:MAG TPA: hypothetical protein VHD32_15070 [Candidatus Didemnitutus sp.]|nr:hypothetical protein [Candidatus Didemnitutus sp.]